MGKVLRVGVIGTGFIGRQHIEAIRRIPDTQVTAIADIDADTVGAVGERLGVGKRFTDFSELIRDPEIDVIHNCTPSVMHFPINREVISMGKHIYCEKPLALNSEESAQLAALASEHDVAAGVNFNYRHNAVVQEMRQRVSDGRIGRVLMLTGQYLQDWLLYDTDYDWRLDPAVGGKSRAIADIGSHCFDTAQFILGRKIVSVYAQLITAHPVRRRAVGKTPDGGTQYSDVPSLSEDGAFILGRFEDGTPVSITVSQVSAGKKNALSLTVSGSGELLEWDQQRPDLLNIGHRDQPNEVLVADAKYLSEQVRDYATLPAGHPVGWHDALTNAIRSYYRSIRDGGYKNPEQRYATFRAGHEMMRLVDACLESNEKNQWINL